jgi:hypothetical protein
MTTVPNASGLVFSKESLELPENPSAILEVLSTVLAKPFVQNIAIDASGEIVVSWYKDPSDSLTEPLLDESPETLLDRIELMDSDYGGSLKSNLVDAFVEVSFSGYLPTYILCGSVDVLKSNLGMPKMVKLPQAGIRKCSHFLGTLLEETPSLPEDTLVVCGSRVRSSDLQNILFGVRLLMEESK